MSIAGQSDALRHVRYVITLDTDTQLPRDAARMMVGTLAHRLNRPVIDAQSSTIVDGYVILQPRVGVSLPSAQRSRFVQLYTDDPGVDPYTRVVSDVYQDVFAEGSFIGKGIYEVDAFETCCGDFPENAILSHDLIEGAYSRSALLSDVTLYEDHPSRYAADVGRKHRWMRGDWQIAAWLLRTVRGRSGRPVRNPISALSRWKIFDNLRRSLVPPAMLLVLLGSWFLGPAVAMLTLIFILSVTFVPALLTATADLLRKPIDLPWGFHLRGTLRSLGRPLARNLLSFALLPYEAYICGDAIVRTVVRVVWTQCRLLEWKTASDSERGGDADLLGTFRAMIVSPAAAVVIFVALYAMHRELLWFAGPWLALWTTAPLVVWWLSRPITKPPLRLSVKQHRFLNTLARKTWRYFEEFVTAEHHWLPPDNVQQNPTVVVAPRTSPTNIGMALLADLAAYDFGYCSAAQLLTRTQRTFDTLSRLERHRGHFFNWYDTRSLAPLHPRYVSMVDSGNLVGNLLVLESGYIELVDAPILPTRWLTGLADTLHVLLDTARGNATPLVAAQVLRNLERQIEDLRQTPLTIRAADALLSRIVIGAEELRAEMGIHSELAWWADAYSRSCQDHQSDLRHLAPWLALPAVSEVFWEASAGESRARRGRLRELLRQFDASITVRQVAALSTTVLPLLSEELGSTSDGERKGLEDLNTALLQAVENAAARIQRFEQMAMQCRELAEMDFGLLYDGSRELFAIGYNVSEQRLDAGFYDLLASEARLASFIVIAQGNFGQEHWFALSRQGGARPTSPSSSAPSETVY